jgi:hypothetical protein
MTWTLVWVEETFSAWRNSENPDPYLFEHVFNWVQQLAERGPDDIPGARLKADGGEYSILVQETRVQVDFTIEGEYIILAHIGRPPPGAQDVSHTR